ncbi:MAG: hypothetical protein BWY04_00610 [candidate division CPR1 bacterium ADurb.Bin160]|uniref:Uncharacterized protein n=1 Tax=candidate division CPR1 bacterium ADurb.Bin160 TaxID=1852826 RepID=A0A1V5ZP31_9BACT|nr:MAG: hypothetical protein BWY04_00610 [candidate division CPR1 bacterium ADurb.Bin160]
MKFFNKRISPCVHFVHLVEMTVYGFNLYKM